MYIFFSVPAQIAKLILYIRCTCYVFFDGVGRPATAAALISSILLACAVRSPSARMGIMWEQ